MKTPPCAFDRFLIVMISLLGVSIWQPVHAAQVLPGELLNVHAQSGLRLRTHPDINVPTIAILDYGDQVQYCGPYSDSAVIFRDDWYVDKWLHVEVEGIEGYVYGGYVSALPIPVIYSDEINCTDAAQLLTLFVEQEYSAADSMDWYSKRISDGSTLDKKIEYFDNGMVFIQRNYESGYNAELQIPDVTVMEVFNLMKGLYAECDELIYRTENPVFIKKGSRTIQEIKGEGFLIRAMPDHKVRVKIMESPIVQCCAEPVDLQP